ncbi:MAG: DNA (cytosine-5-)-methyltransferase, partial [bacterium]
MESNGHKCVGWCENDIFAQESYRAIYNTEGEWFKDDAKKIRTEDMPDFDVLCAGFPCQSFSIAGRRKGFKDTRGTLFFEITRIVREKLPKILLLENVKGLLNHANGKTFLKILQTLDEVGYDAEWQVLNSKDFGVPQNRERV